MIRRQREDRSGRSAGLWGDEGKAAREIRRKNKQRERRKKKKKTSDSWWRRALTEADKRAATTNPQIFNSSV